LEGGNLQRREQSLSKAGGLDMMLPQGLELIRIHTSTSVSIGKSIGARISMSSSSSKSTSRRKFRSQTSEKSRREKMIEESRQKKEDADARKGRKVAKHSVFPMICGSGGSKSRLAKAGGAEPAGQMRDEKVHAVVARSTFPSQNVQNIPASDHFWKLRCRKSARHCGVKQILKSKC